ncbi:hypothetical protein SADUNF_Sadunf03G0160700 [Salix dunnii]|uniref:Uncharacterized protein n=1 Tax=Salix dunnii TaxID=1413687 RepID=A0A835N579_9ROSI|nr:hypothetical protein SADUNF_Sadunf03G0160700 [Salix dunnii]
MGRGRGKGKKLTVSNDDDTGSGEEEKIPAQKRRGRPQKPLKDDNDEEEVEKIEDENAGKGKTNITSKDTKSQTAAENGKKRKRYSQAKEKPDSLKEENGVGTRSSTDDSTKSNGFRHNGSRRKNKPRRAAEAGVEWHNALNDAGLMWKFPTSMYDLQVLEVFECPEDEAKELTALQRHSRFTVHEF